jgi:2,4-dienoyl-CoA reductase-like NADH-dependent reductase (Old Yellow Enzyme family)
MIITGFAFTTRSGRAMQPLQAGLDTRENIAAFRKATDAVHQHDCPIILQLAHTGRQTLASCIGTRPVSGTTRRSVYFRQKPRLLLAREGYAIADQFAASAWLAQEAGFDGVQLHAAHGYLIHQLLLPDLNRLTHEFGVDPAAGLGTRLLEEIIRRTRERCGAEFPILVKISGDVDGGVPFYPERFLRLIRFLDEQRVAAIEISYGTMDYAMNIFRGELQLPLVWRHNPLFRTRSRVKRLLSELYLRRRILPKIRPFSAMYNVRYAEAAKALTDIPIISVGGFRSQRDMEWALAGRKADLIGMARPFLCEPDLVEKLARAHNYVSRCDNCNRCVVMCDAGRATMCYKTGGGTTCIRQDARWVTGSRSMTPC